MVFVLPLIALLLVTLLLGSCGKVKEPRGEEGDGESLALRMLLLERRGDEDPILDNGDEEAVESDGSLIGRGTPVLIEDLRCDMG